MAKAKPEKEPDSTEPKVEEKAPARRKCGLIMPISARDGLSEAHWREVKDIFETALNKEYDVAIVSDTEGADIIHKRIVYNLFTSDVCVCDISTQNPNVMFELGIRLSFDKPTVVVKDDKTAIPFDTNLVRCLTYPRDLRYQSILLFKDELARYVENTVKNYSDPAYSFMKAVGDITIPKVGVKEVSGAEYIEESLDQLKSMVGSLVARERRRALTTRHNFSSRPLKVQEVALIDSIDGRTYTFGKVKAMQEVLGDLSPVHGGMEGLRKLRSDDRELYNGVIQELARAYTGISGEDCSVDLIDAVIQFD